MTNWASPLLQASLVTGKTSARSNAPATAIHVRLVAVDLLVTKPHRTRYCVQCSAPKLSPLYREVLLAKAYRPTKSG